MTTLTLTSPSVALARSYRDLVAEFVASHEQLVPFTLAFDHSDFSAFLAKLEDCSRGISVPDGFVPHSTFWLVRDSTQVVGVSNIRHSLTPSLRRDGGHIGYGVRPSARGNGYGSAILQHSLAAASQLGITRALITCAKHNVPSARVILGNGGALESEELLPERDEIIQRYWIEDVCSSLA